jgi:alpha-amylase
LPKRLYDLDTSKYGNKQELKSLIAAFRDRGVKSISNIVINHRTAEILDNNGLIIFEGGTPDTRLDWDISYICSTDVQFKGTGNPATQVLLFLIEVIDNRKVKKNQTKIILNNDRI